MNPSPSDGGYEVGHGRALVLFLLVLPLCWAGLRLTVLTTTFGEATRAWVETPCTITRSDTRWVKGETTREARTASVKLTLEYVYKARLKTYTRNRVSYHALQSDSKVTARFKPGDETTCRVDPDHPGRAVLVGPDEAPKLASGGDGLLALLAFLFAGASVFASGLRMQESLTKAYDHWEGRDLLLGFPSLLVPVFGIVVGIKRIREGAHQPGYVLLMLATPWAVFLLQYVLFALGLDLPP